MASSNYVAVAKDIQVLGQTFQSFLTENGEVVFSKTSTARGLDLSDPKRVSEILASKSFKSLPGHNSSDSENNKLRAVVGSSTVSISVVTLSQLAQLVNYLAEKGDDRAIAMQQASFAVMLQQSVDVAYNVTRESAEYTDSASQLATLLEKQRKELREMSGRVTNPYLACNTYTANNNLIC
jgi:hypothetical protein